MINVNYRTLNSRERTSKMPAHNERFGATAAERADLKGSAEMPPLRQAAIPLGDTRGHTAGFGKTEE